MMTTAVRVLVPRAEVGVPGPPVVAAAAPPLAVSATPAADARFPRPAPPNQSAFAQSAGFKEEYKELNGKEQQRLHNQHANIPVAVV
jgi:hypothetical protein